MGPQGGHWGPQGGYWGPEEGHWGLQGGHWKPERGHLGPQAGYKRSQGYLRALGMSQGASAFQAGHKGLHEGLLGTKVNHQRP